MATVRYLVHDVDAALAFYTGPLGFALVERRGPPFAMVRRDDLTLWLAGPGTSAQRPLPGGAQPVPGGWNRLVLEVADLDATVAALRAAGVPFRGDVVSGPGGRQVLVEDPSGNPVELFAPRGA
ncbi:MAG: VOC family protein [Burkholderiales bacterium]